MKSTGEGSPGLRIIAGMGVIVLLAGVALVILQAQTRARDELERRFELRTEIATTFVSSWVDDFARREGLTASTQLRAKIPTRRAFEELVHSQQLAAAVLLDEEGSLLQVWPPSPDLVGTNLAKKYPHLEQAVDGERGVSNVVPSAAEGTPVVAIAVPYETPSGRRVFSGAFTISKSPIGKPYLGNVTPITGSRVYLVDSFGKPLGTSLGAADTILPEDRDLFRLLEEGKTGSTVLGDDFASVSPIKGTPWRIAIAAPQEELFSPIEGWPFWAPWIAFTALAAAAGSAWRFFEKLARSRAELSKANDALVIRNAQIQEAASAQRRFISSASHELRTPLTSILGYLDLVMEAETARERENALGIVQRNAKRLYGLIDSLMMVFRSEVEHFVLEEVDLYSVVADSVEALRPAAKERLIELHLDGSARPTILGDRDRLTQVLDNLLSNAIKYSREGGRVAISVESSNSTVTVTVTDNGIGVPEDELEKMFERFFRASTARRARIAGTGLGLAISRTIIQKHGGAITISSVEGQGTTMSVTIPIAGKDHKHG